VRSVHCGVSVANDYLPIGNGVVLHTENGMLGMGRAATGAEIDPDLINAGKAPVTDTAGASYFHHADSFAMMRGGHLDVWVLGAFQVSVAGNSPIGAKDVFVMMTLFTEDGSSKLVRACTYPLTGINCVSRVYTDYGVFLLNEGHVHIGETFGISVPDLQNRIGLDLQQS